MGDFLVLGNASALAYALPVGLATCWFLAAPVFVKALNPRLPDRNPAHFGKLVRFSRGWGLAAVAAGVLVGKLL